MATINTFVKDRIGFGSFQVAKANCSILPKIHKSGVCEVLGWGAKGQGFEKVVGIRFSKNYQRKVVGVGLGKTGTTSLALSLKYLGYSHQWYKSSIFLRYKDDRSQVLDVLKNKDSCEDFPWPFLYQEIDRRYPDSLFILTTRKSPEIWYQSLCKHFDRGGENLEKRLAYGYETPHGYKAEHIQFYLDHYQSVIRYFADKPQKLLMVCWENGDGWKEICNFLGHPVPEISFPHANKAPN